MDFKPQFINLFEAPEPTTLAAARPRKKTIFTVRYLLALHTRLFAITETIGVREIAGFVIARVIERLTAH
jgi:hypothetical protein